MALDPWSETRSDVAHEWRMARSMGARVRVAAAAIAAAVRLLFHSIPTGSSPMRNLGQDVRYAVRRLRHAAGFSMFAVATLGLGIGATTAVYSVVHALVMKAPEIPVVDAVQKLYHWPPDETTTIAFSWPDFEALKSRQTSFEKVAAWARFSHAMALPDGSRPFHGEMVDGDYFDLLRVQPLMGRLLQPADDDASAPPVIVIGEQFWRSAFAADPEVVGRSVAINGNQFQIVGVAPDWFRGVNAPNLLTAAAWVPIRQRFLVRREGSRQFRDQRDIDTRFVHGLGRLRADRSVEDAAAELRLFGEQRDAAVPIGVDQEPARRGPSPQTSRRWSVRPLADSPLGDDMTELAPFSAGVLLVVCLVLMVVCTNLANLMLARGASRRQEMSVRLALGASRARLIREQLIESTLLAAAGGLVAVVVSQGLMVWLSADIPLGDGVEQILTLRPELNPAVFAMVLGATMLALLSFGLVPAWHSTRTHVREVLSDASGGALPRWKGRRILIAGQVTVSLLLLGATAISVSQIATRALQAPGFDLDRLSVVSLDASLSGLSETRVRDALDRAVEQVRRLPGVEDATLASRLPVPSGGAYVYAGTGDPIAFKALISRPDFFALAGVRLMAGRAFDDRDTAGTPEVAVLSQSAATQLFGTAAVIGELVELRRQDLLHLANPPVIHARVIGVSADTTMTDRDGHERGLVYLPLSQHFDQRMLVVARTSGDPSSLSQGLRAAVVSAEPQLAILQASTGAALADETAPVFGVAAGVTGLLGGFALFLSLVGLYGVLSFVVSRRTREIGVRIALGARPDQVQRMMLADGLRPVAWGLIIGGMLLVPAMLSPIAMRLPAPAANIVAVLTTPVLMMVAAAAAAWWPARRASRTDPNVALRNL